MTTASLKVQGLAVSVADRPILIDVHFSLEPGQALGIVGETGSGKSVTCRALVGLLNRIGASACGEVQFGDLDLLTLRASEWGAVRGHRIALVAQNSISGLDPIMRVGNQVSESVRALDPSADPKARALELLDMVRMPSPGRVMKMYPHELSGGMRQRVVIAMALAGSPELLIADEPTTALDVTVQRSILDLLSELRREQNMSMVLISHDLDVIRTVSDSVVIMYGGRTVERGPLHEALASPQHPYTKALIAAQPSNAIQGQKIVSLPGLPPAVLDVDDGCPFAPRCPDAEDPCMSWAVESIHVGPSHFAACRRVTEAES